MTGTATRPRVLMELRFMYLLPDWFAATPALVAPGNRNRLLAIIARKLPRTNARSSGIHPFRLIHCALRAYLPTRSGSRFLEQNVCVRFRKSHECRVRRAGCGAVPSVTVDPSIGASSCSEQMGATLAAPLECDVGGACTRSPPASPTAGSPHRRHRELVHASRPFRTRHPSGSSCR